MVTEPSQPLDTPGPRPGPLVVLVGPMGAGKTTVGTELARRLGVPFTDTDHAVEQDAGCAIGELFATHGEAHFRDLEHRVVARELADGTGVLALGGGAVTHPQTRRSLLDRAVVFLDASAEAAVTRTGPDPARPLLAGSDPHRAWRELMDRRRPLYQEVATMVVLTDALAPGQVAQRIAARLGLVTRD